MEDRYLEITYRHGKPFAAYLFLPRHEGDRCERSENFGDSLVIDFAADGRAIGIEIIHPQIVTVSEINRALASVNQPSMPIEDFAPLKAA